MGNREQGDGTDIDPFDDLFEPFELDETPPPPTAEPPPPQPEPQAVTCPSCGTPNPPQNRHCESCGARIAQGPLPVAPQPMLRTTPGARALGILAAVILIVAVLALIVNLLTGSDDEEPETGDTTDTSVVTTDVTTPVLAVDELTPNRVTASSELPGFEAEALIDDDDTNSWNDESLRGEGAVLTFFFVEPVQISQIVIQNVEDNDRFLRNYRIEGLEITLDDLGVPIIRTLEDTTAPQTIDIGSLETNTVTMRVTSVYEAQPVGNRTPFEELALQEVKFFGRLNSG